MPFLEPAGEEAVLITVQVQPRASRNRIVGAHGRALKVTITAPPVEGKANLAVIALLAKRLGLPKSAVTLAAGRQSRRKRFRLAGISLAEARAALAANEKEIVA